MDPTYAMISAPEKSYGEESLLQTQMALLNSLNRLRDYRKLRKEEINLKVSLKSKIDEVFVLISELRKMFPKVEKKTESDDIFEDFRDREDLSVRDEIERISMKLERLRAGGD